MKLLQKTLKIKLNPTLEQAKILESIIRDYNKVANFVAEKIVEIQQSFEDSESISGICSICNKEKKYKKSKLKMRDSKLVCLTCYKRAYSQYTIQKVDFQNKIGVRKIGNLPNSYYANAIRFISDTFVGFDEIKRIKENQLSRLKERLNFWKNLIDDSTKRVEKKFKVVKYAPKDDKRENPHFYSEAEIKGRIKRLSKKIEKFKLPSYPEQDKETISIQRELYNFDLDKGFTMSGVTKRGESIDYFGKTYIKTFQDNIKNSKKPVLLIKKENGNFFACYPLTKESNVPEWSGGVIEECPDSRLESVGIDWGIRHLMWASFVKSESGQLSIIRPPIHITGGYLFQKRRKMQLLRKYLGRKKRSDKIKFFGDKESRFIDKYIHDKARELIEVVKVSCNNPVIVMEDINDNREESDKYLNRILTHSVRSRLQNYIKYKAEWEDIPFVLIKPEFTSQICSKCGNHDRNQRGDVANHVFVPNPGRGKTFKCQKCNYTINADLNASVNIAKKYYGSSMITGAASS